MKSKVQQTLSGVPSVFWSITLTARVNSDLLSSGSYWGQHETHTKILRVWLGSPFGKRSRSDIQHGFRPRLQGTTSGWLLLWMPGQAQIFLCSVDDIFPQTHFAHLSLPWSNGWVALSFLFVGCLFVPLWWHPTKSPLFSIRTGIKALYWPSFT